MAPDYIDQNTVRNFFERVLRSFAPFGEGWDSAPGNQAKQAINAHIRSWNQTESCFYTCVESNHVEDVNDGGVVTSEPLHGSGLHFYQVVSKLTNNLRLRPLGQIALDMEQVKVD